MIEDCRLKIEYLRMSLRSVIFLIGLFKIDPPEADLKYSFINSQYSIFFHTILLDIADDFIFNFFREAFSDLAVHGSCGDLLEFFNLLL